MSGVGNHHLAPASEHLTRGQGIPHWEFRVLSNSREDDVWNLIEVARNVLPVWQGTLSHPQLHDFWADDVRVTADQAMPYQLGGDARGHRQEMRFTLAEFPVTLVGQA